MKSIKTRITTQILIFSLILLLPVLGIFGYYMYSVQNQSSDEIILNYSRVHSQQLNESLRDMEVSVHMLTTYITLQLENNMDDFFQRDYRDRHVAMTCEQAKGTVELTEGALCIYYALNIDICDDNEGFYLIISPDTGELTQFPRTPIKQYDKEDISNVGWYYQAVDAGHDIWMAPYSNAQGKGSVISYISPIYIEGIFVGIVGMDLAWDYVVGETDLIRPYETGYGFLLDSQGNPLYHPGYPDGVYPDKLKSDCKKLADLLADDISSEKPFEYKIDGEHRKKYIAHPLRNGMVLVICVESLKINEYGLKALILSIFLSLLVMSVCLILISLYTKKMLRPVDEMVDISQQLAEGNFEVDIAYDEDNELGTLAKSFRKMAAALKANFDVIHGEAFIDDLTGLNNRNSYIKNIEMFSSCLDNPEGTLTIYVMDVNNLKIINDTKGHGAGDELLKTIAGIIRNVFGKNNVYRFGGDEFAAIFSFADSNPEQKIMEFQMAISKQSKKDFEKYECQYQVAAGYAIFDRSKDHGFADVFARADSMMYSNKRRLKEIYQNSRKEET